MLLAWSAGRVPEDPRIAVVLCRRGWLGATRLGERDVPETLQWIRLPGLRRHDAPLSLVVSPLDWGGGWLVRGWFRRTSGVGRPPSLVSWRVVVRAHEGEPALSLSPLLEGADATGGEGGRAPAGLVAWGSGGTPSEAPLLGLDTWAAQELAEPVTSWAAARGLAAGVSSGDGLFVRLGGAAEVLRAPLEGSRQVLAAVEAPARGILLAAPPNRIEWWTLVEGEPPALRLDLTQELDGEVHAALALPPASADPATALPRLLLATAEGLHLMEPVGPDEVEGRWRRLSAASAEASPIVWAARWVDRLLDPADGADPVARLREELGEDPSLSEALAGELAWRLVQARRLRLERRSAQLRELGPSLYRELGLGFRYAMDATWPDVAPGTDLERGRAHSLEQVWMDRGTDDVRRRAAANRILEDPWQVVPAALPGVEGVVGLAAWPGAGPGELLVLRRGGVQRLCAQVFEDVPLPPVELDDPAGRPRFDGLFECRGGAERLVILAAGRRAFVLGGPAGGAPIEIRGPGALVGVGGRGGEGRGLLLAWSGETGTVLEELESRGGELRQVRAHALGEHPVGALLAELVDGELLLAWAERDQDVVELRRGRGVGEALRSARVQLPAPGAVTCLCLGAAPTPGGGGLPLLYVGTEDGFVQAWGLSPLRLRWTHRPRRHVSALHPWADAGHAGVLVFAPPRDLVWLDAEGRRHARHRGRPRIDALGVWGQGDPGRTGFAYATSAGVLVRMEPLPGGVREKVQEWAREQPGHPRDAVAAVGMAGAFVPPWLDHTWDRDARRVFLRELSRLAPAELTGFADAPNSVTWRDLMGAAQLVAGLEGAESEERWEELLEVMTARTEPSTAQGDEGLGAAVAAFAELLRAPQARLLPADRLLGIASSLPSGVAQDRWVQLEWCRAWHHAIGSPGRPGERLEQALAALDEVPESMAPMLGASCPDPAVGQALAVVAALLPGPAARGETSEAELDRLTVDAVEALDHLAPTLDGPALRALRSLLDLGVRRRDPGERWEVVTALVSAARAVLQRTDGPMERLLRAAGDLAPPGFPGLELPLREQVEWLLHALQRPLDLVALGPGDGGAWVALGRVLLRRALAGWREGLVQRLTFVSGLSRLRPEAIRGEVDAAGRLHVRLLLRREGDQELRGVRVRLSLVEQRSGEPVPRSSPVERDWRVVDGAFPDQLVELSAEAGLPAGAWSVAVEQVIGDAPPLRWRQPIPVPAAGAGVAESAVLAGVPSAWGHLAREVGRVTQGVLLVVTPGAADTALAAERLAAVEAGGAGSAVLGIDMDHEVRELGPGRRYPDALSAEALYRILAGLPPRGTEPVNLSTAEELARRGLSRLVIAPLGVTARRMFSARREVAEQVGRFLAEHEVKARSPAIVMVVEEEFVGEWWALIPAPVRILRVGGLGGDDARREVLAIARGAGCDEAEAHAILRASAGDHSVAAGVLRAAVVDPSGRIQAAEERLSARALQALRAAPPAARFQLVRQAANLTKGTEARAGGNRGPGRTGATRGPRSWGATQIQSLDLLSPQAGRVWVSRRSGAPAPAEPGPGTILAALAPRKREAAPEWAIRATALVLSPPEFWEGVDLAGLRQLPRPAASLVPGPRRSKLDALHALGALWHELQRGRLPEPRRVVPVLTDLLGAEVRLAATETLSRGGLVPFELGPLGRPTARLWLLAPGAGAPPPLGPVGPAQVLLDPYGSLQGAPPGFVHLGDRELRALLGAEDPDAAFWAMVNRAGGLAGRSPFRHTDALEGGSKLFFGRRRELDEFSAQAQTRNFLILGPRKIGKTSLLEQLLVRARQRGLTTLRVEGQGVHDEPTLREALAQAWRSEAARLEVDGGGPVGAGPPPEGGGEPGTFAALDHWLWWARSQGKAAILFLNEVDGLLAARPGARLGREDLLAGIRARLEDSANHLRVVFVGYAQCQRVLGDPQSTLHRLFVGLGGTVWNLSAFDDAEALELLGTLTGPLLRLAWRSQEERRHGEQLLLRRTYRIPWVLQSSCHNLLEQLDQAGRGVIEYADVAGVFSQGAELLDYLLGLDLKDFLPGSDPDQLRSALCWFLLFTAVLHTHLGAPPQQVEELLAEDPAYRSFTAEELGDLARDAARRSGGEPLASCVGGTLARYELPRFLDGVCLTAILGRRSVPGEAARYFFQHHLLPVELLYSQRRGGRAAGPLALDHLRTIGQHA